MRRAERIGTKRAHEYKQFEVRDGTKHRAIDVPKFSDKCVLGYVLKMDFNELMGWPSNWRQIPEYVEKARRMIGCRKQQDSAMP